MEKVYMEKVYELQFKQLEEYVSSLNKINFKHIFYSILYKGFHKHSNEMSHTEVDVIAENKHIEIPAVIVGKLDAINEIYEIFEFRFVDDHIREETLCELSVLRNDS